MLSAFALRTAARMVAPRPALLAGAAPRALSTISGEPLDKDIALRLRAPVIPEDVRIRPDGFLYMPAEKYRHTLLDIFGPAGWALRPTGPFQRVNTCVIAEYELWMGGRYISSAYGEQTCFDDAHVGRAVEAARSNALVRCCKDVGMFAELWDEAYAENWKNEYAKKVPVTNKKTGGFSYYWMMKDAELPHWLQPASESNNSRFDDSTPSPRPAVSNQTSQPAPWRASGSGSTTEDLNGLSGPLDLDSLVPPFLKKYKGKTWSQVLNDAKGPQYLGWVVEASAADDATKNRVRMALKTLE